MDNLSTGVIRMITFLMIDGRKYSLWYACPRDVIVFILSIELGEYDFMSPSLLSRYILVNGMTSIFFFDIDEMDAFNKSFESFPHVYVSVCDMFD